MKIYLRTGLLCAAMGTTLIGATAHAQSPEPVKGGEMIFAAGADLASINPVVATGHAEVLVGCVIYEGLTEASRDGAIGPKLAKSWEISEDGLTYTFHLRDARWSDGTPFTSADVAYSLIEANAKVSPLFRSAGQRIASIDTPDPQTAVINLNAPFGPFLLSLSCIGGGSILPKHVFAGTDVAENPASQDAPVGTGPFLLDRWTRGQSISIVRNPDYWDADLPYLDRITGQLIAQESSRVQALRAGEIDFIIGRQLLASSHAAIRANADLKLEVSGYPSGTTYMEYNLLNETLGNPQVRKALAMAIDRPYLLRAVWFDDGEVSIAPFSASISWALNPAINFSESLPFDPDRANQMLDEAGFARNANGVRFTLRMNWASNAPDRQQYALAVKSMWQAIGVELEPLALDPATYADVIYSKRDFDLSVTSLNTFSDPALGITRVYDSAGVGRNNSNASGYANPAVDALFAKGNAASTHEARATFYKEAQTILAEDLPVLPVREAQPVDAASAKLFGVWHTIGAGDFGRAFLQR